MTREEALQRAVEKVTNGDSKKLERILDEIASAPAPQLSDEAPKPSDFTYV